MQLKLDKHQFCQLDGIVGVKNHLGKLRDVVIENMKAKGIVEINISYHDQEGPECFKSLTFPFEIILDELKLIDVDLGRIEVCVVEGQGLDIQYELIVNYMAAEPKKIDMIEDTKEIEMIPENHIQFEEKENLEKIKEDISEFYEDQLATKLNREDHVIISKSHEEPIDFLNFFEDKKTYYKIKCLEVRNETDLNQIAEEYHVSLDKLLAGYDRKARRVLFTI